MGAQEVHDAIVATLKPGEYVPAEVKFSGASYPVLRYVSRDGYRTSADPGLVSYRYREFGATIVRLLDTRTDDDEWVAVTERAYDEAWYREGKSRVRYTFTRDSDGEWAFVYFIHRDDLTPPAPDADLIRGMAAIHDEWSGCEGSRDGILARLAAAVREHDAKAGEQS